MPRTWKRNIHVHNSDFIWDIFSQCPGVQKGEGASRAEVVHITRALFHP